MDTSRFECAHLYTFINTSQLPDYIYECEVKCVPCIPSAVRHASGSLRNRSATNLCQLLGYFNEKLLYVIGLLGRGLYEVHVVGVGELFSHVGWQLSVATVGFVSCSQDRHVVSCPQTFVG